MRDLDGIVSFYKIGYQLAFAGGLDFARELAAGGTKVFLDMKLLDIDNTVAKGVENIVRMGVTMLTLHAYPKAMRAAVEAAQRLGPLPARRHRADLDGRAGHDRRRLRIRPAHAGAAPRRAGAGRPAWAASSARPSEAAAVRKIVGPELAVVTPGIRPAGGDHGDQKRVMTPADAIRAGASHLVVARPIVRRGRPARRRRRRSLPRWQRPEDTGRRMMAEGILDRPCRCARPRRLQGLCRGREARLRQIWREDPGARRRL